MLDLLVKDAHLLSDARAARALQVWTLVFHPSTDNSYSKTRTQDDTIAIGASAAALAWIGEICSSCRTLNGRGGLQSRMFPLSSTQYSGNVKSVAAHLGLGKSLRTCSATAVQVLTLFAVPLSKLFGSEDNGGTQTLVHAI